MSTAEARHLVQTALNAAKIRAHRRAMKHRVLSTMHNPALMASYSHLANHANDKVDAALQSFEKRYGRPAGALTRVTAQEFKAAVADCLAFLKARVGDEPYALLTQKAGKSVHWLSHLVIRAMGRNPVAIDWELEALARKAAKVGVRAIVHLDDGVYSGSQMEETLHSSGYARTVPVYIAAAYATPAGEARVRGALNAAAGDKFFVARRMEQVTPNGKTMTIMPHKVPDDWSLANSNLSYHLASALGRAPYKTALGVRYARDLLPPDVYRRGNVVWEIHDGHHKAWRYPRGSGFPARAPELNLRL